jgi:short-subunit dehydrogenase
MTYLVAGASSGLGRALAEELARSGHALVLVSSDLRDTSALAADLHLRYDVMAVPVALDLAEAAAPFSDIDAALANLPPLAGILLPAGMTQADDEPGESAATLARLTRVNYSTLCQIVNCYLPQLRTAEFGLVVGFGSVAAVRGRGRNAAYAAAKRAIDSYFESLRHALAGSSVIAQFYVLGYLDTNLAFGQRTLLPRADPRRLAQIVLRRRRKDFGRAFYPKFWYPVCILLRMLPWGLFRRLSL